MLSCNCAVAVLSTYGYESARWWLIAFDPAESDLEPPGGRPWVDSRLPFIRDGASAPSRNRGTRR